MPPNSRKPRVARTETLIGRLPRHNGKWPRNYEEETSEIIVYKPSELYMMPDDFETLKKMPEVEKQIKEEKKRRRNQQGSDVWASLSSDSKLDLMMFFGHTKYRIKTIEILDIDEELVRLHWHTDLKTEIGDGDIDEEAETGQIQVQKTDVEIQTDQTEQTEQRETAAMETQTDQVEEPEMVEVFVEQEFLEPVSTASIETQTDSPVTIVSFDVQADSPVSTASIETQTDSPVTTVSFDVQADSSVSTSSIEVQTESPVTIASIDVQADSPVSTASVEAQTVLTVDKNAGTSATSYIGMLASNVDLLQGLVNTYNERFERQERNVRFWQDAAAEGRRAMVQSMRFARGLPPRRHGNDVLADGMSSSSTDESPGSESSRSEPSGSEPSGSDPSGSEPSGSEPSGSNPSGSESSGSDPSGSEPSESEPSGSDPSRKRPADEEPAVAPAKRPNIEQRASQT